MNRSKRLSGFAYLWVLFLVAFMGLGLAVGVEIHLTSAQRDKEAELLAIGRQFRTAIGRYHEMQLLAGRHEYPATLDDLLKDNRMPGLQRHLRKLFVDPMTAKSEWGLLLVGGRIVGVHSISERKPIKQDHFEAEDMGFRNKEKYSEWVFTYPPDLLLRAANDSPLRKGEPELAAPFDGPASQAPQPQQAPQLPGSAASNAVSAP